MKTVKHSPRDLAFIEAARDQCNDDLDMDDTQYVRLSKSEMGRWVSAWIWVYDDEVTETLLETCRKGTT